MAMKPRSMTKGKMMRGGMAKKATMARGGSAAKMEEKLKKPAKAKAGASFKK